MGALPTGMVTFLFTDIEGSTRLLEQLGDRYAGVLATHHRLLRTAIQDAHGHEMGSQGDALFAAFPRAKDALLAAVAAQRAVQAYPWPDGITLRVRMGLHTGEPLNVEPGGELPRRTPTPTKRRVIFSLRPETDPADQSARATSLRSRPARQ